MSFRRKAEARDMALAPTRRRRLSGIHGRQGAARRCLPAGRLNSTPAPSAGGMFLAATPRGNCIIGRGQKRIMPLSRQGAKPCGAFPAWPQDIGAGERTRPFFPNFSLQFLLKNRKNLHKCLTNGRRFAINIKVCLFDTTFRGQKNPKRHKGA